jgi:hypothetical protein
MNGLGEEINSVVFATFTDNGTFHIVVRDRMNNPTIITMDQIIDWSE